MLIVLHSWEPSKPFHLPQRDAKLLLLRLPEARRGSTSHPDSRTFRQTSVLQTREALRSAEGRDPRLKQQGKKPAKEVRFWEGLRKH